MSTLTSDQREKAKILKRALGGDGDALDRVIVGDPDAPFGTDQQFYRHDTDLVSTATTWETVDEVDFVLLGGNYHADMLTYYYGDTVARQFQLRLLINDTQIGDIVSREPKDVTDRLEFVTISKVPLSEGPLNVKLQVQVLGGVGTLTVSNWRIRIFRSGS